MKTATRVSDFMTRNVITLREEEDLTGIEEGMKRFRMRHIPVVDGDRLVGLISHRDVLRLTHSILKDDQISRELTQRKLQETFVADIMKRNVVTVHPDTPVKDAARTIVKHHIGCLPVVEEGNKLVGIITEHDFARLVADESYV